MVRYDRKREIAINLTWRPALTSRMRALAGAAPHVSGGECRHHRREGGECCGRGVGVGRDSSSRGGERPGYTASSK